MKRNYLILGALILSIVAKGQLCESTLVYWWNFNWPSCNDDNYILQFEALLSDKNMEFDN